ncbi:MAG: hypothetical protein NXH75_09520, partial [Halobacteriovoraceae bacterium]|nr:hypothetical protein [Halobacteriovoraceae bacterium]
MRLKIFFLFLFLHFSANTKAGWLCHEASSMREGRILTTCGIGYGKNEAQARENALEKAYKELDSICDRSVDCKNQELYIEPLRNECLFEGKQHKCYRGITATITKRKRPKEKQTQKERSKERIEVIIKNEIIQQEKVTAFSCDYNYGKIGSLLKENQITKAVKLIKEVPFKLKCSQLHYKFMRTLVKLNKFPSSYVSYLYSLVSTFEGDWNDHRPTAIFDYLYQKGDWDIRGWKRIYLAVKSTSPGKFYRYSTLLFHLDSKSQKTQSDRLIGLLEDIKNQRIGFPDKLSFQKAFTSLLCRVPKDESHFWFWEVLFTSFEKTKPKISRSKDILSCLKKSQKWNLSEKEKKQVTNWI